MRTVRNRGADDRIETPYEPDARLRSKRGMHWTGYMVHLTETCDTDMPHLVLQTDTTPADVHEARRTGPIHTALAARGMLPSEQFVDGAYVSAELIVDLRDRHGVDLVGPTRRSMSKQRQAGGGFDLSAFVVDWTAHQVRCSEGKINQYWHDYSDKRDSPFIKVRFARGDCVPCPSRARCFQAKAGGRQLSLHTRAEHDALIGARSRGKSENGQKLYAQRQGVEGTIAQGVHRFGLRRCRYRGLEKTRLQHIAAAGALNLERLSAWLAGNPLAKTRVSRFAKLGV